MKLEIKIEDGESVHTSQCVIEHKALPYLLELTAQAIVKHTMTNAFGNKTKTAERLGTSRNNIMNLVGRMTVEEREKIHMNHPEMLKRERAYLLKDNTTEGFAYVIHRRLNTRARAYKRRLADRGE